MTPRDRDVILRRRALLVASALGAITSSVARAEECPPLVEPTLEAKAAARQLFEQAQRARTAGEHEEVLRLLRQANELAPIPGMLLPLAQAEHAAGKPAAALGRVRTFVRCFPDAPKAAEAAAMLEKLEQEVARLTLRGGAESDGFEVFVDDVRIGALPILEDVALDPGVRRLSFQRAGCERTERLVTLTAGEKQTVTVDELCQPPQVCLQPCLSPPPPWDGEWAPRFGVGGALLGFIETVDDGSRGLAGGGRIELFYHLPLGETFTLRLGLAALPSAGAGGALVPVGPDVEAAARLGPVSFGLGAAGGYAFSSFDASGDDDYRPVSSGFIYPYVLPVSLRAGENMEVGSHFGVLLSGQESREDSVFGPTQLAVGLFVRLLFGDARRDTYYDEARSRRPVGLF